MTLLWRKVKNERFHNTKAEEAEHKGHIVSAYSDGYATCIWDIREKGSNIPLAQGKANDINTAKSHATKILKTIMR